MRQEERRLAYEQPAVHPADEPLLEEAGKPQARGGDPLHAL